MKEWWEENKAVIKLIGLCMMGLYAIDGLWNFIQAIIAVL